MTSHLAQLLFSLRLYYVMTICFTMHVTHYTSIYSCTLLALVIAAKKGWSQQLQAMQNGMYVISCISTGCMHHDSAFILSCVQVHFTSCSYIDQFGSSNVIFLAAESPNILTGMNFRGNLFFPCIVYLALFPHTTQLLFSLHLLLILFYHVAFVLQRLCANFVLQPTDAWKRGYSILALNK